MCLSVFRCPLRCTGVMEDLHEKEVTAHASSEVHGHAYDVGLRSMPVHSSLRHVRTAGDELMRYYETMKQKAS